MTTPTPEGTPAPTQQERAHYHLGAMVHNNEALYERILDTPGFAFHFNELCKLAATAAPAPLTREPTWLPFNINWRARVRLNDKGRRIWSAYWNETPTVQAQVDADGWLDQQAWHLMEVFGEHLHIGADSPFETEWQLYFERLPAAEEGARAPQRHMAFVASKQTAPPLTIYEAEGARAAAPRPVFNDGKCPKCDSIDTRGRMDGETWHSHCETCGHRWTWMSPNEYNRWQIEPLFTGASEEGARAYAPSKLSVADEADEGKPYVADAGREVLDSPCAWCGYNGAGYWQTGTHDEKCPWFTVGGLTTRASQLRREATSLLRGTPVPTES